MEKFLDILIPVVIVIFIIGGKLFSLLKERGFDFSSLLQPPDEDNTPAAGNPTRRAADAQDYNEAEWGDTVIVVPPAAPAIRKIYAAPVSVQAVKFTAPAAKPAVKNAPLFPESSAADNDEFHSSYHSRGAYYSGYIHAHGRDAIVLHEILSKPKGLE